MESIIRTINGTVYLAIKYGDTEKYDAAVDLTKMFGAGKETTSIDDPLILTVEQYALTHQDNNPGELVNFSNSAVVSRGRNLFDPSVFDGIRGITKDGEAYVGHIATFYANFGMTGKFLPLVSAVMPEVLSVSIDVEVVIYDGPNGGTAGKGLYVVAQYTDGSEEGIVMVPNSATAKRTYSATTKTNKIIKNITLGYEQNANNRVRISNIMITAGPTPEPYMPFRSISCNTSAIVQKYFPDGMKSAGTVHDEIDFERMVAIQRVGSVVYDGVNTKVNGCDNNLSKIEPKYNYAYISKPEFNSMYLPIKINGKAASTIGWKKTIGEGHAHGGVYISSVICLFIPNVAIEGNTQAQYIAAFNNALQANPVTINYELATPIETPITETFDPSIEVESGGSLTFENDQGADFHVPVPNQETFMIKLPGGTT